jgi:hypothetical protein
MDPARLERLDTIRSEGRLVRQTWTGTDGAGRDTACLLAALSPEAGAAGQASACPADVMPAWLAHLTPWVDDAGTAEHWPEVVSRYAALAHRWSVLTPATWGRLDYRVRGLCVREAMRYTKSAAALAACETVAALCEWAADGDMASEELWAAAAAAAAGAAAAGAAGAADRLIDAILGAIEAEVGKAEAP